MLFPVDLLGSICDSFNTSLNGESQTGKRESFEALAFPSLWTPIYKTVTDQASQGKEQTIPEGSLVSISRFWDSRHLFTYCPVSSRRLFLTERFRQSPPAAGHIKNQLSTRSSSIYIILFLEINGPLNVLACYTPFIFPVWGIARGQFDLFYFTSCRGGGRPLENRFIVTVCLAWSGLDPRIVLNNSSKPADQWQ